MRSTAQRSVSCLFLPMFGVCLQSCEASHGPMGHPPAPPPSLLQLACWQSSSCAEWFGCGRHTHGECRCRHHRYSSGWPPYVSHSGLSVPKLSKTCHFVFGTASREKIHLNCRPAFRFSPLWLIVSPTSPIPQIICVHKPNTERDYSGVAVCNHESNLWNLTTASVATTPPHAFDDLSTPCKFSNSSTPTHCIPVCQVYSSRGRLDKTHRHFMAFAVCSSHPSDLLWHQTCGHIKEIDNGISKNTHTWNSHFQVQVLKAQAP